MRLARVVLDTNVLISAIVFGGKPRQVFQQALSGDILLISSEVLLDELCGVLGGPKFKCPQDVIRVICEKLASLAEIVSYEGETIHAVHEDPDDNRVLECALAGGARYIVTGDPDLLQLASFRDIAILNPAMFIKIRD